MVGTGRHVEKVQKAFAAVQEEHPKYEMRAMQHEITHKDEWEQVVSATVEEFGKVDILVNNASVTIISVFCRKMPLLGELRRAEAPPPAWQPAARRR